MKPAIPTTVAVIGALALFATGCYSPRENAPSNATTLAEGETYPMSNVPVSKREAQIAQMRATNYYSQLTPKQQKMIKNRAIRYLAVDSPSHRSRGYGSLPVLLYDIQICRLVSLCTIKLPTPPQLGQVLNINGYRSQYIRLGSM